MNTRVENWSIAGIIVTVLFFLVYMFGLNHVSVNHIGIAYNSFNGELQIQDRVGWHVTSPFVRVMELPTMPIIVHIPSYAKVINTKIVRLRPEGIKDLIKLQGFNMELGTCFESVMMGYAFSGQKFSFLEIVQEGGFDSVAK
jgi:hypothetical protein